VQRAKKQKALTILTIILAIALATNYAQALYATNPYNYTATTARGNSCSIGVKITVAYPVTINSLQTDISDTAYAMKITVNNVPYTYYRNNSNSTAIITPSLTLNTTDNITIVNRYNASGSVNNTWAYYNTKIPSTPFSSGPFTWTNIVQMDDICSYTELALNDSFLSGVTVFNYTPINASVNYSANEIGTNNSITGFTLNFSGNVTYTPYITGLASLTNSSYVIRFNKTGYFNTAATADILLNTTTYNFTNATRYYFKINLTNAVTGLNDSSFTITATSTNGYTDTKSTVNGTLYIPWFNDTNINLTVTAASSVAVGSSFLWNTSNYTTTPMLVNISYRASAANGTTFYIYDENTSALINTTNVTIELSGSTAGYNLTTSNGSTSTTIAPGTYTITYSAPGYLTRTYTFTLTSGSSTTIPLFLVTTTAGDRIRFTVTNTQLFRVSNATVITLARNSSGYTYYTVQNCITDSNGQCLGSVILYDQIYRFVIQYGGVTLGDSGDTQVSSTEIPLVIQQNPDVLSTYFQIPQITYSLSFDRTTGYANITVSDLNGIVETGCVNIYRKTGALSTLVNTSCASSSTFTTSTHTDTTLGDSNTATATVYINGQPVTLDSITLRNDDTPVSGNTGLVLLAIVFGVGFTIALTFGWDPTSSMFIFTLVTIMFWYVGLLRLLDTTMIVLAIVALIMMLRTRQ
jgi:hypothetical protein